MVEVDCRFSFLWHGIYNTRWLGKQQCPQMLHTTKCSLRWMLWNISETNVIMEGDGVHYDFNFIQDLLQAIASNVIIVMA